MSIEQQYRQSIQRWADALQAGDWAAFDKAVDETVTSKYVYHIPGREPVLGAEGIKKFFRGVLESIPDYRATIEDAFVAGDKAAARSTIRRTDPATGKTQRTTVMMISHLKGGKYAEDWQVVSAWVDEV